MNPIIGPFVSKNPSFIFKRARSLKDHLVSSEFNNLGRKDPCKYPGTFTWGGCNFFPLYEYGTQCDSPPWGMISPETLCQLPDSGRCVPSVACLFLFLCRQNYPAILALCLLTYFVNEDMQS